MRFINRIFATSLGLVAIQGILVDDAWSSKNLKVSRISMVSAEPSKSMFPHDLNPNRKLKYPSVTNMHLSFLSIGDNDEASERIYSEQRNRHAVYNFNLSRILKPGEPWFHAPVIISDTETAGGFSGNADKEHITGIFRGELLQQSKKSTSHVLKRLRSREIVKERELLVRDLKPILSANVKTEYMLADEKGLWENTQSLIRCRKLMNFDYVSMLKTGKRFALLDYYDDKNTPLVELVSLTNHKNCGGTPLWSTVGVFPRFSPQGNFLAIVQQVQDSGGLNWQLQIYDVSKVLKQRKLRPVLAVNGVSLYDVRTDVFKYLHSFSWVHHKGKDVLYFKRTAAGERRRINRISCGSGKCSLSSPLLVNKTFCMLIPEKVKTSGYDQGPNKIRPTEWKDIIWVPTASCNGRDIRQSELDEIIWFSPFIIKGDIGIAAQVLVRHKGAPAPSTADTEEQPWLTRIAILTP